MGIGPPGQGGAADGTPGGANGDGASGPAAPAPSGRATPDSAASGPAPADPAASGSAATGPAAPGSAASGHDAPDPGGETWAGGANGDAASIPRREDAPGPASGDAPSASGDEQSGTGHGPKPGGAEPKPGTGESKADAGESKPDAGEPGPAGGRAGRNLPAAIAVGAGLGALTVISLYTVKALFLAVVAAAVGVGIVELARSFATRDIRVPVVPLVTGMVAMVVGPYWGGPVFLVGTFTLTLMVVMSWRMLAPPGDASGMAAGTAGYVRDASAAALICAYPGLIAGFVPLLLAEDDGSHRVVVFVAVTVCSDIGGYVAGVLFGRHKMSPIISPKKTWEGFAGSALACVVCGALLVRFLLDGAYWQGALLGAVVVVFATLGDLIESVIKRDLGIKDMGNLLPGHGGLMDRLDSLLFTLVPVWLLLSLFG